MGVVSLGDLWDALVAAVGKHLAQIIAGVIVLLIIEVLRRLWKLVARMIRYYQRLERARQAVRRMESPAGGWIEGKGLWTSEKPIRPPNYAMAIAASKVLIAANAKGGVGKTTVCASLGARLSEILDKPVLMIDLDFQGSLSSMSIADKSDWLPPEGLDSPATYLVSGDLNARDVASTGKHATRATNLKIIPSYYDLAQAENRIMVEWLIGDRKADVRFQLAEILLSDTVRNTFSLILIDCPPRLTTGAIQALAAATHVLIPTRLEEPSTEAVITFVQQVEAFREAGVCPYIKYVGVVPTMVVATQNTEGVRTRLSDALDNAGGVTRLLDCSIPQAAKFRETSGEGITYLVMGNAENTRTLRGAVQDLATAVRGAMGL